MLESEDQPPSEISVLLTGTEQMRALNQRFRSIDKPTDVLSFPSGEGPELVTRQSLGDIAVCIPVAEAQAGVHDVPTDTEVVCLAVHGGLHLLGYDDSTSEGRLQMLHKMDAIVLSLGMTPAEEWGSDYKA